jgi:5-oxoprolinase (ATP-hydrolysing)
MQLTTVVDANKFSGLHAILSGPAGGVVGCASTAYDPERPTPVIGFDMGGTSTDVSRYDGHFDHIMETTTAGVTIQSPQLDICTIAAGGGSMLFWENGLFRVGPESAGASPGPACYRKGGPLTVTDANVLLGRLLPSHFPHIFGSNENLPLDIEVVRQKFTELADQIKRDSGASKSAEEIAIGFLQIATEAMCSPIRTLSEARGHETASHNLACFGGAGGQVACSIATALGIPRIIIHKSASVLSAFGIALADLVEEAQESFAGTINDRSRFEERLSSLQSVAEAALPQVGEEAVLSCERYLNLRYEGTDATLMIREPMDGDWSGAFTKEHHLQFGFSHTRRAILVDDVRVRVISSSKGSKAVGLMDSVDRAIGLSRVSKPNHCASVYFDQTGWTSTNVYMLPDLVAGSVVSGPAIIVDKTSTILLTPSTSATLTDDTVIIDLEAPLPTVGDSDLTIDPIQLSVFGHRFMAISEQMGRVLQKTAVSVNIKERLDFSCALFDPEGRLVANAPHVPAMLGSMQFAVKWQADHWRGKLRPGDVLLSNHPVAGGVHLPDFTIVTPVFDAGGNEIIFCES